MASHPGALVGRWVHSRDEDAGDVRTYRRDPSGLPLARRPRSVLELRADGRVLSRSGGPADTLVGRDGRWEASDLAHLILRWDAPDGETEVEIVERQENLLRLRPLRGAID